jgi:hypothetical protein
VITREQIEQAKRGKSRSHNKDANMKRKATKRKAARRELIAPRGSKRYIRRDPRGRVKESDEVGRSLTQDRRRKAKSVAKPGQGDRGDRRSRTKAKRTSRRVSRG